MPRLHCTSRMCFRMSIDYCGVVPINYVVGNLVEVTCSAKALLFTSNVWTVLWCSFTCCATCVRLVTIRTRNLVNYSCLLVSWDMVLRVTKDLSRGLNYAVTPHSLSTPMVIADVKEALKSSKANSLSVAHARNRIVAILNLSCKTQSQPNSPEN